MATVLQDNVLDDLLGVVDDLRSDLHANFGTRPYRLFVDVRTYSGARLDGTFTVNSTEITPAPQVDFEPNNQYTMLGSGKISKGDIVVSRISLENFSEDMLLPTCSRNQEVIWRLVDNHGENVKERYFIPAQKPVLDRDHTIGWVVRLTERQTNSGLNGV